MPFSLSVLHWRCLTPLNSWRSVRFNRWLAFNWMKLSNCHHWNFNTRKYCSIAHHFYPFSSRVYSALKGISFSIRYSFSSSLFSRVSLLSPLSLSVSLLVSPLFSFISITSFVISECAFTQIWLTYFAFCVLRSGGRHRSGPTLNTHSDTARERKSRAKARRFNEDDWFCVRLRAVWAVLWDERRELQRPTQLMYYILCKNQ